MNWRKSVQEFRLHFFPDEVVNQIRIINRDERNITHDRWTAGQIQSRKPKGHYHEQSGRNETQKIHAERQYQYQSPKMNWQKNVGLTQKPSADPKSNVLLERQQRSARKKKGNNRRLKHSSVRLFPSSNKSHRPQ